MRTLCVSIALVIAMASTAFSVENAGPTWNQFAASYHFDLYPVTPGDSFAQHYHGDNLDGDFNSILSRVNQVMSSNVGPGYDDLMNATLQNWQENSH